MWVTRRQLCVSLSLPIAIAFVATFACTQLASAQTVSDAELERARQSMPRITKEDMDRAAARNRMPTAEELKRVPLPSVSVDALPKPPAAAPSADLSAIAKGFDAQVKKGLADSPLRSGPALLVFVSFAVPEPTLRRLVDQASRIGATLVLRGFIDGSMTRTAVRIRELIGEHKVAVNIDPQLFDKYGVTVAPTFVVVSSLDPASCKGTACPKGDPFAAVSGDVSVDYALEHIAGQATPVKAAASRLLKHYRTGRAL